MKKNSYLHLANNVTDEIRKVLSNVNKKDVACLVKAIEKSEKVFVFGMGRSFLAMQFFAKRLGHLGISAQVVGSITEKPITKNDILIIGSGSGETKLPVEIAKIAKTKNAEVALITSAEKSTLKSISDVVVTLPCPNKKNIGSTGFSNPVIVKSIQPMGNLFEQCLVIFCDIVCMMYQKEMGISNDSLWKRHANLE